MDRKSQSNPRPSIEQPMIAACGHATGVYGVLAEHQRQEDWCRRAFLTFLQKWSDRFIVQFELHVSELTLCVGDLPVSRLGHYRRGHNDQGLKGEIAINARYLSTLSEWEILGVLLHELLHADEYTVGTHSPGNHHNGVFRQKAASLGLIIGRRGVTGHAASGPFRDLLKKMGVIMPEGEIPPRERRIRGNSKSKKWSCQCTNVRCAIADLRATCRKCGAAFVRQGTARGHSNTTRSDQKETES